MFLVGVCETRFPSNRSRTLWTSSPAVLPAPLRGDARDLPQLAGYDKAALDAYRADTRAHDQEEELRLGYVAFTRAAHRLSRDVLPLEPADHALRPVGLPGASSASQLEAWGEPVERLAGQAGQGRPQPLRRRRPVAAWPRAGPGARGARCGSTPPRVVRAADPAADDDDLDMVEAARVADWDAELERLLAEARAERAPTIDVPLPGSLSATALLAAADDPEAFARELARPMPRPPSPAARFGTRFHAWVEARFGQQDLLRPRRPARSRRRRHRRRRRPRAS